MGILGPRDPLFQEMAIRAPVWGRGDPNARRPVPQQTFRQRSGGLRGLVKQQDAKA